MVSAGLAACSATGPGGGGLDTRVHLVDRPVNVVAGGSAVSTIGVRDFAATGGDLTFTYVASVDAPVMPGTDRKVQATNFAFDASHAYVTYNMAGSNPVYGAFDVIDLSSPTRPRLLASLLFSTAEFADVKLAGNFAYLVGHRLDGAGRAALTVVDISDVANPVVVKTVDLGGYYATSLTLSGDVAYVTTGDVGGVVRVDISDPRNPVPGAVQALANALFVGQSHGTNVVLGGDKSTVLYSGDALSPIGTVSPQPVAAPGRFAFSHHYAITNAGKSRFTVLGVPPGAPSANIASAAPLDGTGNGLTVGAHMLFLAQGEAGTYVADVHHLDAPQLLGHFEFTGDRGSANEVRFGKCAGDRYIFVSDGLDGVRIVRMDKKSGWSADDDAEDDHHEDDRDDEN